jgi:hypothetical protein
MQVRQRSTKKGKNGTILGRWASNKKKKRVYKCTVKSNSKERKNCGHRKAGNIAYSGMTIAKDALDFASNTTRTRALQ